VELVRRKSARRRERPVRRQRLVRGVIYLLQVVMVMVVVMRRDVGVLGGGRGERQVRVGTLMVVWMVVSGS
jgi:hypothetical protein